MEIVNNSDIDNFEKKKLSFIYIFFLIFVKKFKDDVFMKWREYTYNMPIWLIYNK